VIWHMPVCGDAVSECWSGTAELPKLDGAAY
jgi:hypothetical protein